jgi:UDP-N-acetylmuramate dehydrogenase
MTIRVEQHIPLSKHTTLQVGGTADYFVEVHNTDEIQQALQFAHETAVPVAVLGGGSNVLVSDAGYRGLVIKNNLTGITDTVYGEHVYLKVGSGEVFDDVVRYAVAKNFWGLENLSAIPGTVGATPIQNVGAYGVEVSSLITEVSALHKQTAEPKNFSKADCQFGYRDSFFKTPAGKDWIITEVVFKLSLRQSPQLEYGALGELKADLTLTPEKIRKQVMSIRAGKFPDWQTVGTAGSFFKNPIIPTSDYEKLRARYPDVVAYPAGDGLTKVSLGWILDKVCGLKGYEEHGVSLYQEQALVLVNYSAKDSQTIDDFATNVATLVKEKTGLTIEREVSSL